MTMKHLISLVVAICLCIMPLAGVAYADDIATPQTPVEKVVIHLMARNGSGNYANVQT